MSYAAGSGEVLGVGVVQSFVHFTLEDLLGVLAGSILFSNPHHPG